VRRDEEFERLAVKEGILRVLKLRKEIFRVQMAKTTVMKVRYPKLLKLASLSTNKIFNTPPNLRGQISTL